MNLTEKQFGQYPDGEVFAKGEIENSPTGLNMTSSNIYKMLKWVAVKGHAEDWCIYCHWSENGYDYARSNGDKVVSEGNIKLLVPCTKDVFLKYRY